MSDPDFSASTGAQAVDVLYLLVPVIPVESWELRVEMPQNWKHDEEWLWDETTNRNSMTMWRQRMGLYKCVIARGPWQSWPVTLTPFSWFILERSPVRAMFTSVKPEWIFPCCFLSALGKKALHHVVITMNGWSVVKYSRQYASLF